MNIETGKFTHSPIGEVFGKITIKEEENRLGESRKHQAARLGEDYNQFMIQKYMTILDKLIKNSLSQIGCHLKKRIWLYF